jgi:hypothetical protein
LPFSPQGSTCGGRSKRKEGSNSLPQEPGSSALGSAVQTMALNPQMDVVSVSLPRRMTEVP